LVEPIPSAETIVAETRSIFARKIDVVSATGGGSA